MNESVITAIASAVTTLLGGIWGVVKWVVSRLDKRFDSIDEALKEMKVKHESLVDMIRQHDVTLLDHTRRLEDVEEDRPRAEAS
jgi:hypothetical protein